MILFFGKYAKNILKESESHLFMASVCCVRSYGIDDVIHQLVLILIFKNGIFLWNYYIIDNLFRFIVIKIILHQSHTNMTLTIIMMEFRQNIRQLDLVWFIQYIFYS